MSEPRTLLVVGGGIEAIPGIELAQAMGLRVLVTDLRPDAPGALAADDFREASTYDLVGTVSVAREYHETVRPISGVMCIATDVPLTVATVAAELGLPGIPIEAARRAADKLLMKDRFAADGIPVPWYAPVADAAGLRALVEGRESTLVVKPADSRGARGVLRLVPGTDLGWAFDEALRHSPTGRVMVEDFLDGPQVSTESLVVEGVAHTPGFADRNYEHLDRYAPYIIENGGELPSHLDPAVKAEVRDLVDRAAASLGITDGVVKGDIVVSDGEPFIIELAARLSGGYFCTHEIPLSTGVDLVGNAIRMAVGDPVDPSDLEPRFERHLCQRYLFPGLGTVVSVSGADEVAAWPGVELLEIRVQPGDTLRSMDSHPARAGLVLVGADSRQEAIALAERAIEAIDVVVEPA
jgi:biotin carboxylase